jgi:hypothetical protein
VIRLTPARLGFVAATLAAATAGTAILLAADPNAPGSRFPPCMFHLLTGYWCVSCGLTRALHALVHGDLRRAFAMNPLAMATLPLMPAMVLWSWGWQPARLRPLMRVVMEPRLWLVLLPAYWVARNLPWFPFRLLAPGGLLG